MLLLPSRVIAGANHDVSTDVSPRNRRVVSCRAVPCRSVPCCAVLCHAVPFRARLTVVLQSVSRVMQCRVRVVSCHVLYCAQRLAYGSLQYDAVVCRDESCLSAAAEVSGRARVES